MIIRSCQHFNQYQITPDSPMATLPQVAIVGRSNSGKSTLLNAIVGQRQMARTSRRPGRTQEIHYFLINNRMLLVDLPGYGYARVSKAMRKEWSQRMTAYFENFGTTGRIKALELVLMIQDARRDPASDEQWLLDWFAKLGIEWIYLANKADQIRKSDRKLRMQELFGKYKTMGYPRRVVACSAREKTGLEPIIARLQPLIDPVIEDDLD
jgi:GTP-binding protein